MRVDGVALFRPCTRVVLSSTWEAHCTGPPQPSACPCRLLAPTFRTALYCCAGRCSLSLPRLVSLSRLHCVA